MLCYAMMLTAQVLPAELPSGYFHLKWRSEVGQKVIEAQNMAVMLLTMCAVYNL